MKALFGWILLFLGAFLLVIAIVMVTLGPGLFERTPLNVDSKTYLSGTAKKLNITTGDVENVPVAAYNLTQVDPKKSDGKVAVFVSTACVNIDRDNPPPCLKGDDDRVISNSIVTFAADRNTGEANNDQKYQGAAFESREGLVNKFPFNTQKHDYTYWDSTLKKATPAKYVDTTKVKGLETYKFQVDIPTTKTDIAKGTPGTYANSTTLWVEPRTGSIINESQHQTLILADGSPVLDIKIAFTPKTIQAGVDDGNSNVGKLNLLTKIVPIAGGILGILGIVVGIVLIRGRRREEGGYSEEDAA